MTGPRDPSRVLAVILARGGSKGIPRKNLQALGGVPLIGRAVEVLLSAETIDRVVVSTDDSEIASTAAAHGAEIPFLRPPNLALDDTPSMAALEHMVLRLAEAGESADTVVLFQATSPGCRPEQIDEAVQMFRESTATHLKSVTEVTEHPHWMGSIENGVLQFLHEDRAGRRQDLPPLYRLNGAISILRTDRILAGDPESGAPLAYVMDHDSSVDIDSIEDWQRAEEILT